MACVTLSSSFTGQALLMAANCCKAQFDAPHTPAMASRASWSAPAQSHSLQDWKAMCATINSQVASQLIQPVNGADLVHINGGDQVAEKARVDDHSFLNVSSLVPMSSRDANLPRPLSISDLSPAPRHGSTLRVAYQGVPGAYSEAAAAKAYPQSEPVPCDQFEDAFQAVELWLSDRAVLPVENSLGGSIHRNYDLLLRHRLHIVG
eukprot:c11330_g2_i1 orf=1-615(-)